MVDTVQFKSPNPCLYHLIVEHTDQRSL